MHLTTWHTELFDSRDQNIFRFWYFNKLLSFFNLQLLIADITGFGTVVSKTLAHHVMNGEGIDPDKRDDLSKQSPERFRKVLKD